MLNSSSSRRKPRVLLLGSGILGWRLLRALIDCPVCSLVGAIPWSSGPGQRSADRYEKMLVDEVAYNNLQLPGGYGANDERFAKLLTQLGVTCVLIGAWGEILRARVLRHPGVWFVNCHPSRLPEHRGPNPYSSAIRYGATETAVSFHMVDEHIDTGALLAQYSLSIKPDETGGELRERAAELAAQTVGQVLSELIRNGDCAAIAQTTLGASSYFPAISPAQAHIPWHLSAPQIHNHVRGMQPWLKPYTTARNTLLGCNILVTRTVVRPRTQPLPQTPGSVINIEEDVIWVSCGTSSHELGLVEARLRLAGVTFGTSLSRSVAVRLLTPGVRFVS